MKSKRVSLLCSAFVLSTTMITSQIGIVKAHAEDENNYYVCFSNQNYKISNSNKMTLKDGEYVLADVSLNSTISFYVTDANGKRWYGKNDEPLKVKDAGTYDYNIYFTLDDVYDEDFVSGNQYASNANYTYGFYIPDSYTLLVDDTEYELKYNSYQTRYDAYYIDDLKLEEGQTLSVKDVYGDIYGFEGKETDSYLVNAGGYYNFVYTPGLYENSKQYYFDKDGNYGTGDDYKYAFKLDDSEFYYVSFKDDIKVNDEEAILIDDKKAYKLEKDEQYPDENRYLSKDFFVGTKDKKIEYEIYQHSFITSTDIRVDSDEEEYSSIEAKDPSWYELSFYTFEDKNKALLIEQNEEYDGYYLVGDINNYNFTEDGEVKLYEEYKFDLITENDDNELYNKDYDQYLLNLTVTNQDLKNGSFEFYISDGEEKYKNGLDYISLQQPGDYQIVFSNEHTYGRGRNYKYSLLEDENAPEFIEISSVAEFKDMIAKCNDNSDYSYNKEFIITEDLDFKNTTLDSITVFNGTINGSYHSLNNISYSTEENVEQVGLIKLLTKSGAVSNLRVNNLSIEAKDAKYVGLVCKSYGSITGVSVSGKVAGNSYVGGICGYSSNYVLENKDVIDSTKVLGYGLIDRCTNYATITGLNNIGGITGFNGGKITSSTNKGEINNINYDSKKLIMNVGGIAGYSTGYIVDSTNTTVVGYKGIGSFIGGITGLSNGAFYYCNNNGEVSGKSSVGGIIGFYGTLNKDDNYSSYFQGVNYEDIINDYFHDDTDDEFDEQEDLANHLVTYCVNKGTVTSSSYAGGIVGSISVENSTFKNLISDSKVYCYSGSYCGGIAGELSSGNIQSSISTGYLYADGTSNGNYVGGIAGSTSGVIDYCASSVTIKGKNYLGGITGYGSSSATIKSNYSNVLVLSISTTEFKGSIAGFVDGINESNSVYDNVKYNYYVSTLLNGINNINYGNNSDDAAKRLDMEQLECEDELTSYVNINFSGDCFIGGKGEHSYPFLRYFELCDEEETFDFNLSFTTLFNKYTETYVEEEENSLRTSIVITFAEWNKNSGENDNYDNYDVIDVQRIFFGDELPSYPKFKYATEENGLYKFDGEKCHYFVSWNEINGDVFEDQIIYAHYDEIIRSLTDENNQFFIEGEFVSGTTFEITQTGSYYQIHFYLNGKEINYKNYTVKYKIEKNIEDYEVVLIDKQETTVIPSTIDGEAVTYIVFTLTQPGQTFYFKDTSVPLPMWAWLVMTGGLVFIVTLIVMIIIMRVKVKKAGVKGFLRGRNSASNKTEPVKKEESVVAEEEKVEVEKKEETQKKSSNKSTSSKKTKKDSK